MTYSHKYGRNKLCGRSPQYAPVTLTFDLLILKVVVRVTCNVGHFCANFSLPIGLSVLDLGPMYATDVRRQTCQTASSLNAPA